MAEINLVVETGRPTGDNGDASCNVHADYPPTSDPTISYSLIGKRYRSLCRLTVRPSTLSRRTHR